MTSIKLNGGIPLRKNYWGLAHWTEGVTFWAILRQPNFIEYFKHSDQAPDGIRLQVKMDEEHYVQVKLTRFGVKVGCWSPMTLPACTILNKCGKTLSITSHMNYEPIDRAQWLYRNLYRSGMTLPHAGNVLLPKCSHKPNG